MPVRTAYPSTAVAGDVLTAANVGKIPGGWIGYEQVVANQGTITTAVDLTGLTVTVTVGTTRRVRISAEGSFGSTVAADYAALFIFEGATQLGGRSVPMPNTAATTGAFSSVVLTPTAGSHTYKLRAALASGAGVVTLNASATAPAFILVEDLGPAT